MSGVEIQGTSYASAVVRRPVLELGREARIWIKALDEAVKVFAEGGKLTPLVAAVEKVNQSLAALTEAVPVEEE